MISFSRGIVKHVSYGLLGFSIICKSLMFIVLYVNINHYKKLHVLPSKGGGKRDGQIDSVYPFHPEALP